MSRWRRRRTEAGYVAMLTALLASTVFLGLAAFGVDVSRWYLEVQRVQRAADAAALAGVSYMPQNFSMARTTALSVASRNGYPVGGTVSVDVTPGARANQLMVTVTSTIPNAFAKTFGIDRSALQASATAEYVGPAPVGSPCNSFGNEPPSQSYNANQDPYPVGQPSGSSLPSSGGFAGCSTSPNYWGVLEGPGTDKVQGDRYQTRNCDEVSSKTSSVAYACDGGVNSEYRQAGYFYIVHVDAAAVGKALELQAYDPAFVFTGAKCEAINYGSSVDMSNSVMNPWTRNDGKSRYANSANAYCTGDSYPGPSQGKAGTAGADNQDPMTTTFVLRDPTVTLDPTQATPHAGCIKQFAGYGAPLASYNYNTYPIAQNLISGNSAYNAQLSRVFHQWVPLCTFTPSAAGDYYLQVRSNVAFGGDPDTIAGSSSPVLVSSNNPAATAAAGNTTVGQGSNSFALRAYVADNAARSAVSISGYGDMPIKLNSADTTANFYLIRALPAAKGQILSFSFFDAADNSTGDGGYAQIVPPKDASSSNAGWSAGSDKTVAGCRFGLDDTAVSAYTAAPSDCKVAVKDTTTDGRVMNVQVPIPSDYTCDDSTLGGCWFTVNLHFTGPVSDVETWDATISGNPVRLVR